MKKSLEEVAYTLSALVREGKDRSELPVCTGPPPGLPVGKGPVPGSPSVSFWSSLVHQVSAWRHRDEQPTDLVFHSLQV